MALDAYGFEVPADLPPSASAARARNAAKRAERAPRWEAGARPAPARGSRAWKVRQAHAHAHNTRTRTRARTRSRAHVRTRASDRPHKERARKGVPPPLRMHAWLDAAGAGAAPGEYEALVERAERQDEEEVRKAHARVRTNTRAHTRALGRLTRARPRTNAHTHVNTCTYTHTYPHAHTAGGGCERRVRGDNVNVCARGRRSAAEARRA